MINDNSFTEVEGGERLYLVPKSQKEALEINIINLYMLINSLEGKKDQLKKQREVLRGDTESCEDIDQRLNEVDVIIEQKQKELVEVKAELNLLRPNKDGKQIAG